MANAAADDHATSGPFACVVCGVDGSVAADEAVRQAAALCDEAGRIVLVSVAGRQLPRIPKLGRCFVSEPSQRSRMRADS